MLLTFFLFYDTVTNCLIGDKYLSFAGFLPNLSILSFFNHQNINNIINNFILGGVLTLIFLLFLAYLEIAKNKKKYEQINISNNSGV